MRACPVYATQDVRKLPALGTNNVTILYKNNVLHLHVFKQILALSQWRKVILKTVFHTYDYSIAGFLIISLVISRNINFTGLIS